MRRREFVGPAADKEPRSVPGYSEGWSWVRIRGSFSPDRIDAQRGERLRLVFRREETAACSERVIFPSLGKSLMLRPFEDVTVDLGPMPPGEHAFTCGLGVLRGRIVVRDEPVRPRLSVLGGRVVVLGRDAADSVENTERRPAVGPDSAAGNAPTLSRTSKEA